MTVSLARERKIFLWCVASLFVAWALIQPASEQAAPETFAMLSLAWKGASLYVIYRFASAIGFELWQAALCVLLSLPHIGGIAVAIYLLIKCGKHDQRLEAEGQEE